MIVSIELILISFELDFIEEWIKAFEVHWIYILLLFNTFCQDWLVSETNSSTTLTWGKLIVIDNIKDSIVLHTKLISKTQKVLAV